MLFAEFTQLPSACGGERPTAHGWENAHCTLIARRTRATISWNTPYCQTAHPQVAHTVAFHVISSCLHHRFTAVGFIAFSCHALPCLCSRTIPLTAVVCSSCSTMMSHSRTDQCVVRVQKHFSLMSLIEGHQHVGAAMMCIRAVCRAAAVSCRVLNLWRKIARPARRSTCTSPACPDGVRLTDEQPTCVSDSLGGDR